MELILTPVLAQFTKKNEGPISPATNKMTSPPKSSTFVTSKNWKKRFQPTLGYAIILQVFCFAFKPVVNHPVFFFIISEALPPQTKNTPTTICHERIFKEPIELEHTAGAYFAEIVLRCSPVCSIVQSLVLAAMQGYRGRVGLVGGWVMSDG